MAAAAAISERDADFDLESHLTPRDVPYVRLECEKAFATLSAQEKQYAHHLSVASWQGARIVLAQTSEESPLVFDLLLRLFSRPHALLAKQAQKENSVVASFEDFVRTHVSEVPVRECAALVDFAAYFFANLGNYLSFGDSKFVPRFPLELFEKLADASDKHFDDGVSCSALLHKVRFPLYALPKEQRCLAIPPDGISAYYSPDIRTADIQLVNDFLTEQKLNPYNQRLFKVNEKHFTVCVASASTKRESETHAFRDCVIDVEYGDFSEPLTKVVHHLREARKFAANDNQRLMLDAYIRYLEDGDVEQHRQSQRHWIKDVQPAVESNIGFVESYRDPFGARAEFEGFVAVVDKVKSAIFGQLVDNAEMLLSHLPWEKEFHKDSFIRPDFTSLEVLAFSTSGVPAGINLPNYEDIRQEDGFKNVSLANVLSSAESSKRVSLISDADQSCFKTNKGHAFEVQVGLHELLGHGSGKVFLEQEDGSKNFDPSLINPLTGKPIATWYKPGDNFDGLFRELSSPVEECRAECVGLYLCLLDEVLAVFGYTEASAMRDIWYTNWLLMVRAGLLALEFYTPSINKWRQAHMQARFAILRTLLAAGEGLVRIECVGEDNLVVHLEESKVSSVGKPAIGAFLREIMICKATADQPRLAALFTDRTDASSDYWIGLRKRVLAQKDLRKQYVQAHTTSGEDGTVHLEQFDPSPAGMVQSFVRRFSGEF